MIEVEGVEPAVEASSEWQRVPAGGPTYFEAVEFLVHEAELLDNDRLQEWVELLSPDIRYRMPVRTTVRRGEGLGFSTGMHFDEDRGSLELRVRRLVKSTMAWAEDPPSRTRRHVSNVRVETAPDGRLRVRSYLLLYRNRWDNSDYELISCERIDVLERSRGPLSLLEREILVDQATLGALNLAVFL